MLKREGEKKMKGNKYSSILKALAVLCAFMLVVMGGCLGQLRLPGFGRLAVPDEYLKGKI